MDSGDDAPIDARSAFAAVRAQVAGLGAVVDMLGRAGQLDRALIAQALERQRGEQQALGVLVRQQLAQQHAETLCRLSKIEAAIDDLAAHLERIERATGLERQAGQREAA